MPLWIDMIAANNWTIKHEIFIMDFIVTSGDSPAEKAVAF
jgi:hypothetical protein